MARQQKKKKVKSINLWRKRIEFASEVWENAERRHGWHRFVDYFNNRYHEHIHVDIPVSSINKVYAFVKTAVASLYFRDPHITINAKQANGTKSAVIKEQAINYYWREKNIKRQMRKAIGEAKLVGFSYMKIGYDADIRSKTVAGEVRESVVAEDFWAIHIPHTNILYDTECVDPLHDARWVVHWFLKPTKYLQETYPNLEIKPTADINKHHHAHRPGSRARLSKTDAEQTKVFEIWDKDSQTKYLMCDGCDKWLEDPIQAEEEGMIGPLKIEGFPIVMLRFSDIYDNTVDNFPVGEVEVWEEQLGEKIKLRSMQLNHIKRYSRQTWVAKGLLDEAMMNKYELVDYIYFLLD
ncbi:hypothetical protein LCGC14_1981140 [marine sediment metagenome]|uniref:Uncharacterized protein n=1 Tax=marine sediment metagenome TaxID=412755 RepID=A0A0F9FX56_9ZZZZ